jgi:Uma2 family endonuclease
MIRTMKTETLEATPAEATPWLEDQRIVIHGVTWDQYETVRAALDHKAGLRMTYLEGALEIMSPGYRHEMVKSLVGRLVELYALEMDIDLSGYGSMTFRKKALERALEPDECWTMGDMPAEEEKKRPAIAFEVVVTGGGLDKLDAYRGLGVPEVWFWEKGRFSLHRLGRRGYETITRSRFLPGLDFRLIESLIEKGGTQTEVVRAFRDILRKGPSTPAVPPARPSLRTGRKPRKR